jgi:hypothetical protein
MTFTSYIIQYISVIVTTISRAGWWGGNQCSIPGTDSTFLSSPTRPDRHWAGGIKRPEHKTDQLTPSGVMVKDVLFYHHFSMRLDEAVLQ